MHIRFFSSNLEELDYLNKFDKLLTSLFLGKESINILLGCRLML